MRPESRAARRNRRTAELAGSLNEIEQHHGCDPLSPVLCYTPKSCLVVEIKGARLTRLTRSEGADGHGDGAGNVTLHRSDSLHSTSHVAEPAEGSVRPHPLLAGELIDYSLSQQQNRRHRLIIKRNLTGEQGKSTTTPGTSPRRNSNQRNLDPEEPRGGPSGEY